MNAAVAAPRPVVLWDVLLRMAKPVTRHLSGRLGSILALVLSWASLACVSPLEEAAIPVCGVTDGYSSSTALIKELLRRGATVVHLRSSPEITDPYFARTFADAGLSPSERGPLYEVIHQGSLSETVDQMRRLNVTKMAAGAESGVILNDQVAWELGAPGNGIQLARARRNKDVMGNVVNSYIRHRGYRPVKKKAATNADELLAWQATRYRKWPVIVKPVEGLGSYQVRLCHNQGEVREAVSAIIGKRNPLGYLNTHAMIMEVLQGPEYAVNTVSLDGKHKIIDIWVYVKVLVPGAAFLYSTDILLRHDDPAIPQLAIFTRHVLDALGIKQGPAHTEVKLDPRLGPRHMETGGRMSGSEVPEVVLAAQGYSQVTATADMMIDEAAFHRLPDLPGPRRNEARIVFVSARRSGRLSRRLDSQIKDLPGYLSHRWNFEDGAAVDVSRDSDSQLVQVNLVHPSLEKLDEAEAALRKWEADGAFLAP